MAHFLQAYALLTGLKIERPQITAKYFPTAIGKNYITLHTDSELQPKQYSFWQDVVDYLHEPLEKHNIKIMQIGAKGAKPIKKCYSTCGLTTINNVAYLLQGSLMHLGVDSFPCHIASSYDIPVVALYGNTYPQQCGPYWGKNNTTLCGVPKNEKPSYSIRENPKRINNIKVEDIAQAVLKKLGIEHKNKYRTIYIGHNYPKPSVDIVPDNPEALKVFNPNQLVTVRMDLAHNAEILQKYLLSHNCVIVTNKVIDINLLAHFKKNGDRVKQIFYILTEDHSELFVKQLRSLNIPFQLLCEKGGDLNSYKLIYMDYGLVSEKQYPKLNDFKEFEDVDRDKIYYKSNKYTLSNGKIYSSKEAMKKDETVPGFSQQFKKAEFTEDLFEEFQSYYFAEKVD